MELDDRTINQWDRIGRIMHKSKAAIREINDFNRHDNPKSKEIKETLEAILNAAISNLQNELINLKKEDI